jgi:hypothetical protein
MEAMSCCPYHRCESNSTTYKGSLQREFRFWIHRESCFLPPHPYVRVEHNVDGVACPEHERKSDESVAQWSITITDAVIQYSGQGLAV